MTKIIYLRFVFFYCPLSMGTPGLSKGFTEKEDVVRADTICNRAMLLMDSDPSLAMNELNSAKKLNPKDPKILVAIGQVYFRQNKYQEAIESFEKSAPTG